MGYSIQYTDHYIKRLDKQSLADVSVLHAIVYRKKPDPDLFIKKYDTAYTGVENVGYIAYNNDGIPIAFYAVIPCFLAYYGKLVLSAQSADTMTNPNYRFKGLFVELSNLTFELCRKEGIKIIFGFPNQNSYHGAVNKLGWKLTEILQYFTIPAAKLSLEGLAAKHPLLKKIYDSHTEKVLADYRLPQNGVANSLLVQGHAGVERSAAYLAYKTYSQTEVIKLGNADIWIKIGGGLTVGDILLNGDDLDEVIKRLKKLACKLGLKQVVFQASPNSQLYSLLCKNHTPSPSFPVLFQDLDSGLALDQIKFTFADIDIF